MNESGAYNAGQSVGTIIAYLAIYGGIIALGIYFGNRLGRKKDGIFVRWPVGVAIVIVLVLMAGQCSAPANASRVVGQSHG